MSYDIRLCDPVTGETLETDVPHNIRGGMYAMNGTTELWLNVTYNYAPIYHKHMGEDGIRSLYGLTGAQSIPLLQSTIDKLGNDVDRDYWECTEGNAKRALCSLLAFAQMRPDGVWQGD